MAGQPPPRQASPPLRGTEDPCGCRERRPRPRSKADTRPPTCLAPLMPAVLSPVPCIDPQALHAHPPAGLSPRLPSALWSHSPPALRPLRNQTGCRGAPWGPRWFSQLNVQFKAPPPPPPGPPSLTWHSLPMVLQSPTSSPSQSTPSCVLPLRTALELPSAWKTCHQNRE